MIAVHCSPNKYSKPQATLDRPLASLYFLTI